MDSAAAYSMVLPDDGGARWPADCAFAARVVVDRSSGRYTVKIWSVSGSGTAHVDFGDGTSQDLALPTTPSPDYSPAVSHEYAADGEYVLVMTGLVEIVEIHGGAYIDQVSDPTSALADLPWVSCSLLRGFATRYPPMGSIVLNGVRNLYRQAGTYTNPASGFRRIVVQGVAGKTLQFSSGSVNNYAALNMLALEEFYAPGVVGFDSAALLAYRPPFAGLPNLKVLYLPDITAIPCVSFVSPDAVDVRVYVGRLTSVNAAAFTNRRPDGTRYVSGSAGCAPSASACRAELFCKNASSEILALGFPFGADYLKCHCTDMTFDSLGYRFRESDGRRYDPENGQLVNDDFEYVDEAGHLVKYHEGLARWITCDEYGFYVDGDDLPIDPVTGFWIDREGHVCDAHGRKCDTLGNLVAYKYWNPGSADDSMQPVWYADDGYGEPDDYRNVAVAEYGPFWQYVVDRLGGKVTARGNVNLGDGMYGSGDPRADMWYENVLTDDGYFDYYDAKGFLRARERSYEDGGEVYSVVYDGAKEWHLELYSGGEGG